MCHDSKAIVHSFASFSKLAPLKLLAKRAKKFKRLAHCFNVVRYIDMPTLDDLYNGPRAKPSPYRDAIRSKNGREGGRVFLETWLAGSRNLAGRVRRDPPSYRVRTFSSANPHKSRSYNTMYMKFNTSNVFM